MLVINESVTNGLGIYPQILTVDASGPTAVHNIQTYEFGDAHIANIGSSVDPAESHNVSGGPGKTCGFVISFANNESSSGYNKPLIMCMTNTSAIVDVYLNGVTPADSKAPIRISAESSKEWHTWELDRMLKSTEGAVKLTGTIEFSSKTPIDDETDNMTCVIVDQATFKLAEYKTLSLNEGFVEAAENTETRAEIGGFDSNRLPLYYSHTGGYC